MAHETLGSAEAPIPGQKRARVAIFSHGDEPWTPNPKRAKRSLYSDEDPPYIDDNEPYTDDDPTEDDSVPNLLADDNQPNLLADDNHQSHLFQYSPFDPLSSTNLPPHFDLPPTIPETNLLAEDTNLLADDTNLGFSNLPPEILFSSENGDASAPMFDNGENSSNSTPPSLDFSSTTSHNTPPTLAMESKSYPPSLEVNSKTLTTPLLPYQNSTSSALEISATANLPPPLPNFDSEMDLSALPPEAFEKSSKIPPAANLSGLPPEAFEKSSKIPPAENLSGLPPEAFEKSLPPAADLSGLPPEAFEKSLPPAANLSALPPEAFEESSPLPPAANLKPSLEVLEAAEEEEEEGVVTPSKMTIPDSTQTFENLFPSQPSKLQIPESVDFGFVPTAMPQLEANDGVSDYNNASMPPLEPQKRIQYREDPDWVPDDSAYDDEDYVPNDSEDEWLPMESTNPRDTPAPTIPTLPVAPVIQNHNNELNSRLSKLRSRLFTTEQDIEKLKNKAHEAYKELQETKVSLTNTERATIMFLQRTVFANSPSNQWPEDDQMDESLTPQEDFLQNTFIGETI